MKLFYRASNWLFQLGAFFFLENLYYFHLLICRHGSLKREERALARAFKSSLRPFCVLV